MKTPERLRPLVDDGLIDEVIERLMSGKEADVYIVSRGNEVLCAKVYKEAAKRSFKQAVTYTEGRKVRGSRHARAMAKKSKFGRQEREDVWQTAEVQALKRVADAGVRVPRPYTVVDGVLLMELVCTEDGSVAPRLCDADLDAAQAIEVHGLIIREVVRMLCVGLIHGDLSEFNVLMDDGGPVIIDMPQAVDASGNNNARMMLLRDVDRMTRFLGSIAPRLLHTRFGSEIWMLYESGEL